MAGNDLTDGLDVIIFLPIFLYALFLGSVKNDTRRRAVILQVGKKGRPYRWNLCLTYMAFCADVISLMEMLLFTKILQIFF